MKYFILCILLTMSPNLVLANSSFAEHFEYESSFIPNQADDITLHFSTQSNLSTTQRIKLFKQYNKSLNVQIKKHPKKAVLWFIKGLNFKNRLLALEELKTFGSRNLQPVINQTVDYMQKAFNKAIQLDQVKKQKLTAKMYGTMKHNLSSNDRIDALQNELELGGSGDNESQYWFSHWDVIGSLQDEGRFEEAENALYNMKKEMVSAGLEDSDFKQIYQKAKTNLSKDHNLSSEREKTIVADVTPAKPKNKSQKSSLFEEIQNKFESYWLMVLLNIVVILSLIIAFLKREKD